MSVQLQSVWLKESNVATQGQSIQRLMSLCSAASLAASNIDHQPPTGNDWYTTCRPMTLAVRSSQVPRTWACMCKHTCMTATGRTLEPLKPSTTPTWHSPRTPSLTTGMYQLHHCYGTTAVILKHGTKEESWPATMRWLVGHRCLLCRASQSGCLL